MNIEGKFPGLPERIEEFFFELCDAVILALTEEDEHYTELTHKKDEIEKRYPAVVKYLEENDSISLTAEEHTGLIECVELAAEIEEIERKAIYWAGHKDCLTYLQKLEKI